MEKEKREKIAEDIMNEMMMKTFDEALEQKCEIEIENVPGKGIKTHIDGNAATVLIALTSVLKQVTLDQDAGLSMISMLWNVLDGEKRDINE